MALALVIGVVIGMLVPMMYTWAQNQIIQIPSSPSCEQYYKEAIAAGNVSTSNNYSVATERATLYLACREHSIGLGVRTR